MGKVKSVDGDPNSCRVDVKYGGRDAFGRKRPDKVSLVVTHYEDYGVLVRGTDDIRAARRALKKVGYDSEGVDSWAYRPTMVDQTASAWPFGLWVGGTPGVAFYFAAGGVS